VSPRLAILSCLPLGLLLTGCPLSDHYTLQEVSLGVAGTHSGGAGDLPTTAGAGDAAGSPGVADAGEHSDNGGSAFTSGGSGGRGETDSGAGHWLEMASPPTQLVARSKAASVATGKAVFIWGGLDSNGMALDDGAIYYPATDTWRYLTRDPGRPTPRIMATAVWTGEASNKVIVFGGTDANGAAFRDGAVYDFVDNSWAALPPGMSTSKRSAPYGYWDGTHAVFVGGLNDSASVGGADRFDLKRWSTATTNGDPGLLGFAAIGFDGSVMYLQGGVIGSTRQEKVYSYTNSTDKWATLSPGPSARTGAFGAWDGTHFVVWGGQADDGLLADGKTMSGTTWSDMTSESGLSPRRIAFRRSGWAFQVKPAVVAIVAGQTSTSGNSDSLAKDGATYSVQSGQWSRISEWPSLETHEYGIGVWTGEEFVIWGGRDQNVSTLTGERWVP